MTSIFQEKKHANSIDIYNEIVNLAYEKKYVFFTLEFATSSATAIVSQGRHHQKLMCFFTHFFNFMCILQQTSDSEVSSKVYFWCETLTF